MKEWHDEKRLKGCLPFSRLPFSLSPQYFYPSNRGQEGITTDTVLI